MNPLLALSIAAGAAMVDVRTRRIPNWLNYSALAAGLVLNASRGGLLGLGHSLVAALICAAPFVPTVLAGGMGGGDLKLALAIGAILGRAEDAFVLLIATSLFGAALAVLAAGRAGHLRESLKRVFSRREKAHRVSLAYGPAFALGAVVVVIYHL